MPLALVRAGPMRHLSVPSQDTQQVLQRLKVELALPEGARVRSDPSDSGRRLIPFTESVPQEMIDQYPVVSINIEPPKARNYRDHLLNLLPFVRQCTACARHAARARAQDARRRRPSADAALHLRAWLQGHCHGPGPRG